MSVRTTFNIDVSKNSLVRTKRKIDYLERASQYTDKSPDSQSTGPSPPCRSIRGRFDRDLNEVNVTTYNIVNAKLKYSIY